MSFLIKGGYNAFQKTILNISLKKSHLWQQGLITTESKNPICKLNSFMDNQLELVKYNNDMHALLVNNMIVYEKKYLFMYDVELLLKKDDDCPCEAGAGTGTKTSTSASSDHIQNYVTYYWVNYDTIKHLNGQRWLN